MSNYNFFRQHRPMFEKTPEENQVQQPQTYWQPEPQEPENYDYEEDNDGYVEEEIEEETEPDWEEEIEEEVEEETREETEHGYEEDIRTFHSPIQPSFPPLRKLRRIRLEEKCTQKRCAEYLGVSMQYYSQIERGINTLSYPNALKLALFFNTTTDELFKEDYADYDETMQIMMKR